MEEDFFFKIEVLLREKRKLALNLIEENQTQRRDVASVKT